MYTHIEENIYSIFVELAGNPLKNLNAYLIKGEDRNLLIDTGFKTAGCYASLTEGLSELGVSMENTDIFLTHLHADHSGLAKEIASGNTEIFMSELDIAQAAAISGPEGWEAENQHMFRSGYTREQVESGLFIPERNYRSDVIEGVTALHDGDLLHYGGRELRAILTPGHTPGHMCLYDEAAQILFLGDHVLFDITPNITHWRNFPDPLGNYVHSLQKIRNLPVRLPLPAHRKTGMSMAERIDRIIEHHAVRINEVLEAIKRNPQGITAYDIAGQMSWNIRADRPGWENFPSNQKWFAIGEAVAHLDYLQTRNQIYGILKDEAIYYFIKEKENI